ncbi:MAG TPA: hypothetical protein VG225_07170 [Terracidiphilus sp.]|jgi:hypothetical protein|nr:hypothetical protein [Terracidiphilus sp.]
MSDERMILITKWDSILMRVLTSLNALLVLTMFTIFTARALFDSRLLPRSIETTGGISTLALALAELVLWMGIRRTLKGKAQ